MTLAFQPNWYIAKTESNSERRAEIHAKRFKIEPFLPLIVQTVLVRGQRVTRQALMYPGYIFLRIAERAVWQRMRREHFVFKYLLGSDRNLSAEPVGDEIVNELQLRMVDGAMPESEYVSPFKSGQLVRVARGKHIDLHGLVRGTAGHRVEILLTFFNRELPFEFDDSLLVAA